MITRRRFLKNTALGIAGMTLPLTAFKIIDPRKLLASEASDNVKVRWGFLVDTKKCVGCGLCVKACKMENEIPYDSSVTRTWVDRKAPATVSRPRKSISVRGNTRISTAGI
jgi:tetrathionate reductase subunit B